MGHVIAWAVAPAACALSMASPPELPPVGGARIRGAGGSNGEARFADLTGRRIVNCAGEDVAHAAPTHSVA